ncbi:MAG: DUF4350 domain-containing protein [Sandaracinaceae bacterium]
MTRTVAKRLAGAAAVLLFFGLSGFVCQRVGERGRYVGAFSTYGAGPEGTRGLWLLASELAPTRRWAEDLGRLPEGGVLVALGSCDQRMRRPMSRIERQRLLTWIEQGGILLVAGVTDYVDREHFGVAMQGRAEDCRPQSGLLAMLADDEARNAGAGDAGEGDAGPTELDQLPQAFEDDPAATYDAVTEEGALPPPRFAVGVAEPIAGAPAAGLRRPLRIEVDEDAARQTLLRLDDAEGRPLAVRVDRGRGAIVALASASAFQNRDLAAEQGGVLFARLIRRYAPDGPILFDEYHLGVGERRSMMRYLRQVGAVPLILQLLLVLGFVGWRMGARFGAPETDPARAPAGTASYVKAVGTLYQKAKDPSGAGQVLVRRALEQIAAHHHLDAREPGPLAARLAERHRHDAASAVRELADAEPEKNALAAFAQRVDALLSKALRDGAA